ncbi:MAG: hypothetical protein IKX67_05515, partial [Bacteroidales bacterium]|nr:hypothetical protein [Bacteroidales bacterium]
MRKTIIILGMLAAVAVASCNKEMPENGQDEVHAASFTFSMQQPFSVSTKADSYNANEADDFIDRLDMLEYDNNGTLINHKTWEKSTGLDLSSLSYTVYNPKNNYRYWLFLANFDEESIDYLAQLGGYDISLYNKGFIPLEVGNFRPHKPLMGGTAVCSFGSDQTIPVTLFRYVTK